MYKIPASDTHRYPLMATAILFGLFMGFGITPAAGSPTEIDFENIPRLEWTGPRPPITYEEYMAKQAVRPFSIRPVAMTAQGHESTESAGIMSPDCRYIMSGLGGETDQRTGDAMGGGRVLIVVNQDLRPAIAAKLNRYAADVAAQGYEVEIHETLGGTPEDMRAFIIGEQIGLTGVVFVGHVPAPWYEHEEEQFPCDLFYMELDAIWHDTDDNGMYDRIEDGDGDQGPEIFVAHIDASMMTWWDEAETINTYFDKNHAFWTGNITCTDIGFTYTEDDWAGGWDIRNEIGYAYPTYEDVAAPDTDRDDYVHNRLKNTEYEFLQLACHSWSGGHGFTRGGSATSWRISLSEPEALFYNLFCCGASRWVEENHLGAAYIFNPSTTSLTTLGSTKSGSMLGFHLFYEPFGRHHTLGESFRIWFDVQAPYESWEIAWYFGMTIQGDPFVRRMGTTRIWPTVLVGPGPLEGQDPFVQGYGTDGNLRQLTHFIPYGAWLNSWGVNLATGDLDGDGRPDIVTGTGPGPEAMPLVRGFDLKGSDFAPIYLIPYATPSYGANVACGDLDGDGRDEIITGPGPGRMFGPHVRGFAFDGETVENVPGVSYLAYGTNKYGVNVAGGDIDGDGFDEIVTGAGPGAVFGPHVRAWNIDGGTAQPIPDVSYFAYGTNKYGVNVACGDLDGDGFDEIITGAGPGRVFGPHVRGWNVGAGGTAQAMPGVSFFGYTDGMRYGVRVACADVDGDGFDEILTAPGPGPAYAGRVRGFDYDGTSIRPIDSLDFFAYLDWGYRGGAAVAAVDAE